jgi:DNA-binding NarL/FixJ family response regulator
MLTFHDHRHCPYVSFSAVLGDSEQFRQLVSVMLAMRQDLQVVGEAADGSEAVHKAAELKPDLVILDIDLPN